MQSAAFIEQDRDKLIAFALSMIPEKSETAVAIRRAVEARKAGKDWQTAREEVIKVTEDLGWFQAPRNVGFTMIGLLWGEGDFGKSICIAVNCGDDTDCTGATLGSVLGLIGGTKAIPAKWREPIGEKIINVAISGFEAPKDINTLTDKTLAMAKKLTGTYQMPLSITSRKTKIADVSGLLHPDKIQLDELLHRSPYRIVCNEKDLSVTVDYLKEPLIGDGDSRPLKVTVKNTARTEKNIDVKMEGLSEGMNISGLSSSPYKLSPDAIKIFDLVIGTTVLKTTVNRMTLSVLSEKNSVDIPVVLIKEKVETE
jgi:hypothetical protein